MAVSHHYGHLLCRGVGSPMIVKGLHQITIPSLIYSPVRVQGQKARSLNAADVESYLLSRKLDSFSSPPPP